MSKPSKKRLLLMITEGPTDEEFYKKVIEIVRKKNNCSKFNFDEIKYMCSNGIGNMHKNMLSKFKFELCEDKEYGNYEKIVCFCYDKDVFKQNNTNPPINRTKMKEDFEKYGANKIIEIIANNMIEDFFLLDIEGIKKYLKVKKNYKNSSKKSLELLKQIFKDGSRVYSKGTKATGLISSLDMPFILGKICSQIKPLCDELGFNCDGTKCIN